MREAVVFLVGQVEQSLDGVGDLELVVERELHGFLGRLELALWRGDGGQFKATAGIEQELDEAMGVHALLLGLACEVSLKARESLKAEPCGDGLVLERGKEFEPNLGVDRGGDFGGYERRHAAVLSSLGGGGKPVFGFRHGRGDARRAGLGRRTSPLAEPGELLLQAHEVLKLLRAHGAESTVMPLAPLPVDCENLAVACH